MQIDAAYRPNALKRTKDDGSESWVVGYFSSVHCWWRQHCLDNLVWLLVDDVRRPYRNGGRLFAHGYSSVSTILSDSALPHTSAKLS